MFKKRKIKLMHDFKNISKDFKIEICEKHSQRNRSET